MVMTSIERLSNVSGESQKQAEVSLLLPVDRFAGKLVNVTEHGRMVERVRHDVLAVHDLLDGALDAA
jgi:hypothetical protein